jgi:signal transduction histidine kinase
MRTVDTPPDEPPDLTRTPARQGPTRNIAPLLPNYSTPLASLIVALAYSAAGAAGVWLLQRILTPERAGIAASIGIPWLPAGIGVAGLLLFGARAWPGVFAGSCITWGLVQGDAWPMVLLGALSESLSIVLIAWLLTTWGYRMALERYRDALLLIAAAAIGRVVTSGTDMIGLIADAWYNASSVPLILDEAGVHRSGDALLVSPELLFYALRWWANTTAGVILIVPLLAFLKPAGPRLGSVELREIVAWGLISLVWIGAALNVGGADLRPPLIAGALVLVIWAAVRFGVTVAALGTLVFSMTAAVGFGLQLGTFAGIEGREGTEVAWGFIGVLSGIALFLTALLSQRERTRQAIAASAERYRRLFVSNPYPMWAEDRATGQVLLVNPAALKEYGYEAAAFLRLRSGALVADQAPSYGDGDSRDGSTVTAERHRTGHGAEIDVEVTRVAVNLGDRPALICFVEPMSERNAMRLAALGAADLERFRLGTTIATQLIPRLSRVANGAHQLALANEVDSALADELLTGLSDDVAAAILVCKGVTRGVSPLLSVDGDLAESLRQLAKSLPGLAAPLQVSIHSVAPVELSIERRDHVYRLVEDAVRSAAARPGVTRVSIALEAAADSVRVLVEDDGQPAADELANRSMAARAAAANGQLRVISRPNGGTIVRFECEPDAPPEPQPAAPPPPRDAARHDRSARAATVDGPVDADESALPATPTVRWLRDTALLTLAYTATAGFGLAFIRKVDALNVSFHPVHALPWIASGVAVVGLLTGGARLWPAVVVGYVAIWWGAADEGWLTVLLAAAAQAAAAVATAQLLRQFGFRRSFDRLQDFILLVGAAALGRALVVPADLVGLQLANAVSPLTAGPEMRDVVAPAQAVLLGLTSAKLQAVARWWLNGVAGVVLVVPALMSWTRPLMDVIRRQRIELLCAALALAAAVVALLVVGTPGWRLPILALSLTVVTWAALRFGTGPAATATLVLSLAAAASFGLATGALAPTGPDEGLGMLWGFIVLLAAAAQVLTALLAGSTQAERQLQELDRQYRELFEAVPHPVFAFAATDHRIRVANSATATRFGFDSGELLYASAATLCRDPQLLAPLRPDATAADRLEISVATRREARVDFEVTRVAVDLDGKPGILCFAIDVSERNRLRTRVIEATDLERRNLAREFHDGLGQILTGLHLGVASLRRATPLGRVQRPSGVEFVASAADEALRTCEQILRGVSPLQGTDGDLLDAVRRIPGRLPPDARVRLTTAISATSPVTLPLELREHVYQIAQEAVNNSLRHATATEVSVLLTVKPGEIEIEVADDGIGFEPVSAGEGLGLESMRMRAVALRGHLTIQRRPGRGTALRCICPQPASGGAPLRVAPGTVFPEYGAAS